HTPFPYTTLFRSGAGGEAEGAAGRAVAIGAEHGQHAHVADHHRVAALEQRGRRGDGHAGGAGGQVRGQAAEVVAGAQDLDHVRARDVGRAAVLEAVQRVVHGQVPVRSDPGGRGGGGGYVR